MTDLNGIKKMLAPWFRERGFVSSSNRRIWFQDNGFYATVAEIQPCNGMGFIMNVGVTFFWKNNSIVSYDYSCGTIEITVPNATFGALLFDSADFEDELEYILAETDRRIEFYSSLKDISILDGLLEARRDAMVLMNKDFLKRDTSRAITRALLGDTETARELLINDAKDNAVAKKLLTVLDDAESFRKTVMDTIIVCRERIAAEQKIKLKESNINI
jgi:hypothetical protein